MSEPVYTLILSAPDVARCLSPVSCREAIARAFVLLARGRVPAPRLIGFEGERGTFHVKAALYDAGRARFVAKVNGNFPDNPSRRGLPTIQGVLVLADAADGRPLAVMDSASITAIRTAAASAVAAEHLARRDASVAAIVGCGLQGSAHADALLALRPLRELRLFDTHAMNARGLADRLAGRPGLVVRVVESIRSATSGAHLIATCTTGGGFVLDEPDVTAGAFVAAVGADNPYKREIHPALMKHARVVVDDLAQCAAGGDLHHAIDAGLMRPTDVQGELGAIVAGTRPGRERDEDIVVFDSTGIALEDAAAADLVYERARGLGLGRAVSLGA